MENKEVTSCKDCAYVKKTDHGMWCPFHDIPVKSNNYCDNFLDYFQSPSMSSLVNDMKGEGYRRQPPAGNRFLQKDIILLICETISILACVLLVVVEYYL